jgi:Activator of Hsp90 ATPase homolog 1-like protein
MAVRTSTLATPAEGELVITRIVDAPRSLVFKAWTEPEHFVRWWGPNGFTTPFCKMDVRPGGVAHFLHALARGPRLLGPVGSSRGRATGVGRGHGHGGGRVLRDEPARCLQAPQGAEARRPGPNVMEHRVVSREEWLARCCSAERPTRALRPHERCVRRQDEQHAQMPRFDHAQAIEREYTT